MPLRQSSVLDHIIIGFDRALRSLSPDTNAAGRESPAAGVKNAELSDAQRKHAAGLMRVNHAGEVCAQALYQGQALTAKLADVRLEMEHAADEEIDHLAWCEERINELGSHTSLLNPAWYALSFSIGASAGLISDRTSLGFVAATEEQVCEHLRHHLTALPDGDVKSKMVVKQMLEDEERHGHAALQAGGKEFSAATKTAMTLISKAMTATSYRI